MNAAETLSFTGVPSYRETKEVNQLGGGKGCWGQ